MSRLLLAVPLAVSLLIAAPALAQSPAAAHAAAARKAVKASNWTKALEEWQAAYRSQPDADYLVGMGDAYAKLGDKANAKKQYEAYLADPLALDAGPVKAKIAALDKPSAGDLGDLDLAPPTPAAKAKPAANDLGDLDLSAPAPKKEPKGKKGKAAPDLGDLDLSAPTAAKKSAPDLGDLDLSAPSTKTAAKTTPPANKMADLGDLDLAGPPKKPEQKVAANTTPPAAKKSTNDLLDSLTGPSSPPAQTAATHPPEPAKTQPPAAQPMPSRPPQQTAAVNSHPSSPPHQAERPPAPHEAVSTNAPHEDSSGKTRVVAYVTAGVAVASLAVGGLYFTKASQDQTDLTTGFRSGPENTALIEQQKTHKSLAFAGFAAGLVLAGVATALFTF